MSFSDHKITQFTHRISELADQPNLPADELKARFDSSPEELRTAHNAVCDEGEALAARIDAYRTQTFTGEITREMLEEDVRNELDGKADTDDITTVSAAVAAEAAAREDADDALEAAIAQKCELYLGTYTGQSATVQEIQQNVSMDDITTWQTISLGFRPRMVLIFAPEQANIYDYPNVGQYYGFNTICLTDLVRYSHAVAAQVLENGFRICNTQYSTYTAAWNKENVVYHYLAIK